MKRNNMFQPMFRPALLLLVICFMLGSPLQALEDTIIAIVNDDTITYNEFSEYLSTQLLQFQSKGLPQEEIERRMLQLETTGLQRLIEDKIIVQQAEKLGLIIYEKEIDEQVEEIKSRYLSEEVFMEALVTNGATITDLRDKIKEQIQISRMIDIEVKSKIFINPFEVTEYYEKNKDKFTKPERVSLDSIFIDYNNDKEGALQKGKEAMTDLLNGMDFSIVAQNFSDAPSIKMIEKGQMKEDIEKTVFGLEEGELSPLVETDSGYFIFKINKKLPTETATIEEVKGFITDALFQMKFKGRYNKWIQKLLDQAYVEIKE